MGSGRSDSEPRDRSRVDLNCAVQLKFQKFQDFLTEIASNISPGGMFVNSDNPQAPGEQFEFECALADGYPLVKGRAEVVWVRRLSKSSEEPRGMGVRFLELEDDSQRLIHRIVEERKKAGETTFDLDREGRKSASHPETEAPSQDLSDEILAATEKLVEEPTVTTPAEEPSEEQPFETLVDGTSPASTPSLSVPESAPSEVLQLPDDLDEPETEPARARSQSFAASVAGVGQARSGPRRLGLGRFLELLLLSLVVGVGMILLFNQFWVRPRIVSLEAKLEELTGNSRVGGPPGIPREAAVGVGENRKGAGAPTESGAKASAASRPRLPVEKSPAEQAREVVKSWTRAWSEQRLDDYLSYYSAGFMPASGVTRAAWEDRRRDRLLNQGSIRVAVVSLEVQEVTPAEMRVTFTQSYRSDTFRDRVRKTLRFEREDGNWKIAEETVVRQLPW